MTESAEIDRLPPRPGATIEAIRSIGYSFETAIADIVDNCIPAQSSQVEIVIHHAGVNTWLAVVDDGMGMTEDELREAMRIGSGGSSRKRNEDDLGRFGMGLKSAGFSQARSVSVFSKKRGAALATRVWDLDLLDQSGDWNARKSASAAASEFARGRLPDQGTVVLLEKLDGSTKIYDSDLSRDELQNHIASHISDLARHLSRVFGRFLAAPRQLELMINGVKLEPWLPYVDHVAAQEIPVGNIRYRGEQIRCRAYVLPHPELLRPDNDLAKAEYESRLTLDQGFYLYRRDRLICGGGWLERSHRLERETELGRIELDIPVELDKFWELTVDKSQFRPPRALSGDLKRMAEMVRGRSRSVYRNRGVERKSAVRSRNVVTPFLDIGTRRGRRFVRINEDHPLTQQLLLQQDRRTLRSFISVLNQSMTDAILNNSRSEKRSIETEVELREIREAAGLLFEKLAEKGIFSRSQIREILLATDPISNYPEIVADIMGDENG